MYVCIYLQPLCCVLAHRTYIIILLVHTYSMYSFYYFINICCVCSLEESGSTALGPALIISIAMAARVPGSRVNYVHVHQL